jgi:hypothetical protein
LPDSEAYVEFNVVVIEGTFGGQVTVDMSVRDALSPLVGVRVRLAAHHLPSTPIDPTRWGGGSCSFQPNPCPFGHHADPTRMYSFSDEGVLGEDGDGWTLTRFDGRVVRAALSNLDGHRGRVVAAPVVDVEAMRDTVSASGVGADLGVRADQIRAVLERLRSP